MMCLFVATCTVKYVGVEEILPELKEEISSPFLNARFVKKQSCWLLSFSLVSAKP